MGTLSVSMAEKQLLDHIRLGGAPNDEVGRQLVGKFAAKVWQDTSLAPLFRQHGMTVEEVGTFYGTILESLMPEPWMNVSGPMLVPTQWFVEPYRLESLLVEATRECGGSPRAIWLMHLIERAEGLAHATKRAHDSQFGPPKIHTENQGGLKSAGGCVVVLLSVGVTVVGVVAAVALSVA